MTRPRVATLVLLMLTVLVSQAAAFDLNGIWTGTRKCQDLFNGGKEKFSDSATFLITQTGNAIGISASFGAAPTHYTALANFPAAKPDKGEFAMIHCGTNDVVGDDPDYDSIGRFQVSSKAGKVKAKIKGTTIFSDPGLPPSLGTCKFSLTRTDDTPQGIPLTCTPVM